MRNYNEPVFYVHPENPQARLINQAVAIIRNGGVVVYPTDSGYALGCQLENKQALERICQIRRLDDKHNFTLLCRDLSELSLYARVDNSAFRLLKNNTPSLHFYLQRHKRSAASFDERKTQNDWYPCSR